MPVLCSHSSYPSGSNSSSTFPSLFCFLLLPFPFPFSLSFERFGPRMCLSAKGRTTSVTRALDVSVSWHVMIVHFIIWLCALHFSLTPGASHLILVYKFWVFFIDRAVNFSIVTLKVSSSLHSLPFFSMRHHFLGFSQALWWRFRRGATAGRKPAGVEGLDTDNLISSLWAHFTCSPWLVGHTFVD